VAIIRGSPTLWGEPDILTILMNVSALILTLILTI
jgi:hypothetical protein